MHIEQAAASRSESAYEAWSMALNKAFETVRDTGMKVDAATNRCEHI